MNLICFINGLMWKIAWHYSWFRKEWIYIIRHVKKGSDMETYIKEQTKINTVVQKTTKQFNVFGTNANQENSNNSNQKIKNSGILDVIFGWIKGVFS